MQVPDKVAVAYDLCNGPGKQHEAVEGRGCRGRGVSVDNSPDKEEARGHLHNGCRERGADEAWRKGKRSASTLGPCRRIGDKLGHT